MILDRLFNRSHNATDVAMLIQEHLETPALGHVAALEAAARLISHSLVASEVTGKSKLQFPPPVLRDLGRDIVVEGQAFFLLDLPLVHVIGGKIREDGRLVYKEDDVEHVTGDFLQVKWSDGLNGLSALENARGLWQTASHGERVHAEELSGNVFSVIPMPNRFESSPRGEGRGMINAQPASIMDNSPVLVATDLIRRLRGKTGVVPTAVQGNPRNEAIPRGDWQQVKGQPRIDSNTLTAHQRAYDDVLRAIGVPPLMMSNLVPPSREVLRMYCCFLIEPILRLIEAAAAQKGMTIELSSAPLLRYDVAGTARAYQGFIAGGMSDERASAEVGIEPEDDF